MKSYNIQLNGDGNLYISKRFQENVHKFQVTRETYEQATEEQKTHLTIANFYIHVNELEKFINELNSHLQSIKEYENYKKISDLQENQILWGFSKERDNEIENLKNFLKNS